MIPWFLQLFATYRALAEDAAALRRAHEELVRQNLTLQERLDAAQEDRQKLWRMVEKAVDSQAAAFANERAAYQMHVNHVVQKQGGGIPYPDAHSLPPRAVPPENPPAPIPRRQLPSEAVARQTAKFITQMVVPSTTVEKP